MTNLNPLSSALLSSRPGVSDREQVKLSGGMQKKRLLYSPQILAKLLVKMIRLTHTPIHALDTTTWFHIRDEFNASTGQNCDMRIITGKVIYFRKRYDKLKPLIEARRADERKPKKCSMYGRLCTIFKSPETKTTKLEFLFKTMKKPAAFSFTDCAKALEEVHADIEEELRVYPYPDEIEEELRRQELRRT